MTHEYNNTEEMLGLQSISIHIPTHNFLKWNENGLGSVLSNGQCHAMYQDIKYISYYQKNSMWFPSAISKLNITFLHYKMVLMDRCS